MKRNEKIYRREVMAEKRLGIIMHGAGEEKARARRPGGTLRPVTPMSRLHNGVK